MARYSNAVILLAASFLNDADCFQKTLIPRKNVLSLLNFEKPYQRSYGGAISASVYSSHDADNNRIGDEWKDNMRKLKFSSLFTEYDDDDFDVPYSQPKNLKRLSANSYTIELPIATAADATIGMSLRQVGVGAKISDLALDLDSLTLVDGQGSPQVTDTSTNLKNENNMQILDEPALVNLFENNFGPNFEGVIVSEIVENGLAWNAGVRIGDVLVATSATMGDKIWPKTTLDGVRSAFSSRKLMSSTITIQLRKARAYLDSSEVVEKFELSLTRPMGIEIEDKEGYVVVTGFTDDAKKSGINETLRVGDRIVAVDSTVGEKMWPVSNVEGLVSACTTRIPGKPVKLRFERIVDVGEFKSKNPSGENNMQNTAVATEEATTSLVGAVDGFRKLKEASTTAAAKGAPVSIQSTGSNTHKLLLSRSRDLLRRYMNEKLVVQAPKSALSSVPSIVADRVLEALADASAPLDSKTLNLVMTAYSSCRMPKKAILAFEAATGVAGDGSNKAVKSTVRGRKEGNILTSDIKSLDLYTATSLLRAHALSGDYEAAQRVLSAMEGKEGTVINGIPAISWPMKENTDIRCYNIALAAAAKAPLKGLDAAIQIFENLKSPSKGLKAQQQSNEVVKDRVTYNTMIAAFAKHNHLQDALTIFYSMKQAGLKPDKFTYTSLLKALVEDGDIEGGRELMQEMREVGIETDVVTYNTMIKALCDRLQWYKAKEFVTEMEINGISPNSLTYGLLMNGLLRANKPSACLTLFEGACADERTMSITENVQLYTTAITAASKLGNHERAVELLARMKKVGVKPNLKTLTSLMSACLSANQTKQAIDVYIQTERLARDSESFELDGSLLTLAVRAYAENGNFTKASDILTQQKDGYKEMSGKDIMYCYNYLINAALKSGDYEVARSTLTELLRSGYIPSKAVFENIVNALDIDLRENKRHFNPIETTKDTDASKLKYLLFVLDSVTSRKLPISGYFYAAVLTEGLRIGGLGKKITSLLAKARANTKELGDSLKASNIVEVETPTWESLMKNFEMSDKEKNRHEHLQLPLVKVNVGKRDARMVMAAESRVVFNPRQNNNRVRKIKANMR